MPASRPPRNACTRPAHRARWWATWIAVLCMASASFAEERSIELYEGRFRKAEELLPLARAALGDEGVAEVDRGTNQVLLVGSREAVGRALAVLRLQDRRLAQFSVFYKSRGLDELEAAGVEVVWERSARGRRVGRLPRPTGDRIRTTGGFSRGEEHSSFSGEVVVEEGRRARVLTGSSLPFDFWDADPWGQPTRETVFVEAERGFEVSARQLADGRVQVELAPFDARHLGEGGVAYTDAATTLVVQPGETSVVARANRGARHQQRGAPILYRAGEARSERVLLLRVEVAEPASSP